MSNEVRIPTVMAVGRISTVVGVEVSRDGNAWSGDMVHMHNAFRDLVDGIQIKVRTIQQDAVIQAGPTTYAAVGMKYNSEPVTVGIVNNPTK